ncbi:leucine-rich repeat domain-containing protein [Enterococcus sp. AZ072]|uniref:leucine-rich repeat domain-containing protein n=1 Tax=unclassified Enterococcus TaxID=2608891 RepID=UPI003D28B658
MKKTHIFMTALVLCSQALVPLTSFAETTTDSSGSRQELVSEETEDKTSKGGDDSTAAENQNQKDTKATEDINNNKNTDSEKVEVLATGDESIDSWMPDENLQAIVAEILGKTDFTQQDMLSITSASIDSKEISNAQGLSYAKNLTYLSVTNTDLSKTSNLSEIGTLSKLETIIATGDNLSDISFVKSNQLTSLTSADLSNNVLTNLNSIAGINLPNIERLDVSNNLLTDISIIENVDVPKLNTLLASHNQITDISPIAKSTLTSLVTLDASHNMITEIDAFANATFTNLEYLIVNNNQIKDISVMKNLKDRYPNLHVYKVDNNQIYSIEFMEGYQLNSNTSAINQTYEKDISLIKPTGNNTKQYEIAVPITSLDYQYDSSTGYYAGTPDPTAQTLTLDNLAGISAVKLTDGSIKPIEGSTNSVQSFIIEASPTNLPSQVSFTWQGAQGQYSGSGEISVNWVDPVAPVIEAGNQTIHVGESFDALKNVSAFDQQKDGSPKTDLTDKIEVLNNSVDTNKPGTYTIKYGVTNAYGLTTTSISTITVLDNDNKQKIAGENFTMHVGDPKPTASDFKASATDKDGKPSEVSVDLSKADVSKAGEYEVSLTSADGQVKEVKLIVLPKKDQSAPTIEAADKTMHVGDKLTEEEVLSWAKFKNAEDYVTGFDVEGEGIPVSTINDTLTQAGKYKITYYVEGKTPNSQSHVAEKTITLTVLDKQKSDTEDSTTGTPTAEDPNTPTSTIKTGNSTTIPSTSTPSTVTSNKALPKTGEQLNNLFATVGIIVVALSAGLFIWMKKDKKKI